MLTPLPLIVARGRVDKQNVVYGHTKEHSTIENGTLVYAASCDTTSVKVPPWNAIHKRQTHRQMMGLLLTGNDITIYLSKEQCRRLGSTQDLEFQT